MFIRCSSWKLSPARRQAALHAANMHFWADQNGQQRNYNAQVLGYGELVVLFSCTFCVRRVSSVPITSITHL